MLKLLCINKKLYIIYQKRNIVKYVKYCQKPNDKVLTDKILYSVILIKPTPCRKVFQSRHGDSGF